MQEQAHTRSRSSQTRKRGGRPAAASRIVIDEIVFEDADEGFVYCSGRFSVLTTEDDGAPEPGPQAVLIDDALAWARERAAMVVVRVGAERMSYSAGREQPPGRALPRWPEAGLREVRARAEEAG